MSTKPTDPSPWASSANYPVSGESYTGTPTKVVTSGDQQSYGWEPGKKPPAQQMNYWMKSVADWCQYLYDGDVTLHNLTVTNTVLGNLPVAGNVSVGGYLLLSTWARSYEPTAGTNPSGYKSGSGVENDTNTSDVTAVELTGIGGTFRIPLTGLQIGDRPLVFQVAFAGATQPTLFLHYDYAGGAYQNVPLTYDSVNGVTTYNGVKQARYTVDTPTALARTNGLSPFSGAQRASLKIAAVANNTFIYDVSVQGDRIAPPTIIVAT